MTKREYYLFDFLTKREEKNIQKTRKYFSKEFEFNKEILNMLFDIFESISISYSENWPNSKRACMFILPRLIMSTKASLDLLIRGYYFDHLVVERSLMESMALLSLFSRDEEVAKKWLNFEKLELPKWKLVHEIFPSSPTKKLITLINKVYAQESDYVHSSFIAIITEWSRHLIRRKKVLEFPKFQKSIINMELSHPMSLLLILLLIEVFKEELEENFRMEVINLAIEKASEWKAKGPLLNKSKNMLRKRRI